MSADCIRRRCDGSLFHARGPAVAKKRSPSDDRVCGTATVIDSADLRPALALLLCVICVFCQLVVLVRLSVPVQVIDWKDSSPK